MSQEQTCDYDIFISYPTGFRAHVRKLYDKLTYDHNYKCWLDDIEANTIESVDDYEAKPDRPKLNLNVLAEGINNSKVFLCCISKEYCTTSLNIDEINHARNVGKPLVILMMDRLTILELGGVGFIIGPLIRINAYKFKNQGFFEEQTGNLVQQVISSIQLRLLEQLPDKENGLNAEQINVRNLNCRAGSILCIEELHDRRIVCGSSQGLIIAWDLNKLNDPIASIKRHSDSVVSLKKLPNVRLASASMDSTIIIWDMSSFRVVSTLVGHKDSVICLKLLPNQHLCSGSVDLTMRVWDLNSFECIKKIEGPVKLHKKLFRKTKYHTVSFFEKLENINSDSHNNNKNKLDEKNLEDDKVTPANSNKIVDEISQLEIARSNKSKKLNGHTKLVNCLKNIKATLKENEQVTRFASGSHDTLIKVWDINTYEHISTLRGHNDKVTCLKNLPKNRLASGSRDFTIRIWEMDNYTCIKTLTGHNSYVQSLALLPGNKLVSGSYDCTFRLWNLATSKFECIKSFKEHSASVNIVKRFESDRLITSCNEHAIKVWNTKNYECIQTFKDHSNWVSSILVLKCQPGRICTGSWDGFIKIWNPSACT